MARKAKSKSENVPTVEKEKVDKYIEPFPNWKQTPDQTYFTFDTENNCIIARYDYFLNMVRNDDIGKYRVVHAHFQTQMRQIVRHINYFINFYDTDKSYFVSTLRTKFIVEMNPDLTAEALNDLVLKDLITDEFCANIERMTEDLYTLNIDKDLNGDYKSTPKITDAQAKVIVSISFAIRMILPLCFHFISVTKIPELSTKTGYIVPFDNLFMEIIGVFSKRNNLEIYAPLYNFIKYRIDRSAASDRVIWEKKKQVHGDTIESYIHSLVHDVIIVKALYKVLYTGSIVSYIDGIINQNYKQFKAENYSAKPQEISAADFQQADGEDFLSHADALEMTSYRVDESSIILNEANIKKVYNQIINRYNVDISEEELEFYKANVKFNPITMKLLHVFYSRYFDDSTTIQLLSREQSIVLLIILKKFLQLKGQRWLPQICTARLRSRYKESQIKNCKFVEKYKTSSLYDEIEHKFRYTREIMNDNPVITMLSTMLNAEFVWVDIHEEINGEIVREIPVDDLTEEFLEFMYII